MGTMSNWYMRSEMLSYLGRLSRSLPSLRILIVTREDHAVLRQDAMTAGVPAAALVVLQADFDEMPRYTTLFDVGLFFIRSAFSKRASSATKLAEFLACGVPVVINDGVGDSGAIVRDHGVGVVLPALDDVAFASSLPQVQGLLGDSALRDRCRKAAGELFDIEDGCDRYRALYQRLE